MQNMNIQFQTLVLIANFGSTATEGFIAKALFGRRVLPARQTIQQLLWTGVIVRCGCGYQLSDAAKACYNVCVDKIAADQMMATIACI
jgi:hypothetical protein